MKHKILLITEYLCFIYLKNYSRYLNEILWNYVSYHNREKMERTSLIGIAKKMLEAKNIKIFRRTIQISKKLSQALKIQLLFNNSKNINLV